MKQLTWAFTKHVYGKCDVITTPTNVLAKELEAHGFNHVRVLTNSIDYELFSRAKAKKRKKSFDTIRLLYFGRVSFEKRIDVALEALFLLRKKHPHVELSIIGSGPAEESLKKQVRELGIEKNVHFPGAFCGKALVERVKQHNILIAPSPMETQGLYVLEGMAAGLAVVGCNARAIPVALGKNERGLLFDANSPEDCAAKIEKLMEHPALRKKLSLAGKKWVRQFSKKTIAKEWLALYHRAISQ